MKKIINIKDLCNNLSKKFAIYFHHVNFLDVDDKSKYLYLRKIFRDLFICEDFKYDQIFDWIVLKYSMTMQDVDTFVWKSCIRLFFREYSKIKQKTIVIALTASLCEACIKTASNWKLLLVIKSFLILSSAIMT